MPVMQLIGIWMSRESVAGGLATLSMAVVLGLLLGSIRIRGFRLGISGVLFAALLFGQIGLSVDRPVLEFLRDFALIIFVYAIGLQVGPGFISSFRAEGLRLNLLALVVIAIGALATVGIVWLSGLPHAAATGLYSGAFTTTPGLAAGQEALRQALSTAPDDARTAALDVANLAYAATYPFGIVGPMLVIVALRRLFGVKVKEELAALAAADQSRRPPVEVLAFEVTNAAHAGRALKDHPLLRGKGIVLTRLLRNDCTTVPSADTRLEVGDIYRAVGPKPDLVELVAALGHLASTNLDEAPGDVRRADLVVTRTQVLRRTLRELDLIRRTGVTLARINRAGVDLTPRASLTLHFGDNVTAVGPESGLKQLEAELGNSAATLNRTQLVPIFLGIVLGVIVGSIPLALPGLRTPVRIGLAGGPLLVAIVLSQFGNIGAMVWYMPAAANQLFRDFGLAVFLACVGLKAGHHFLQNLAAGQGLIFLAWGVAVTIVPVFIVGCIARIGMKMNFVTLAGWVAGAMTSSPALLFAEEWAQGSEAPAVAYAAVAPLAILAPVICAQLLVAGLV